MITTNKTNKNTGKEATEMKYFKVTLKYFDGKAIRYTDVMQAASEEEVRTYYSDNVDKYCHILKVTEIPFDKANRMFKRMYGVEL